MEFSPKMHTSVMRQLERQLEVIKVIDYKTIDQSIPDGLSHVKIIKNRKRNSLYIPISKDGKTKGYELFKIYSKIKRPYAQIEAFLFRQSERTEYLVLRPIGKRGLWQPIIGGVKPDETLDEALLREIEIKTSKKDILQVIPKVHFFRWTQDRDPSDILEVSEHVYGAKVGYQPVILGKDYIQRLWCQYEGAIRLLHHNSSKEGLHNLHMHLLSSGSQKKADLS